MKNFEKRKEENNEIATLILYSALENFQARTLLAFFIVMNTPHSHVSNGDISTSLSNLSPLQYSGSMQNQSMHNSMAIPQFISYPHYSVSLPSTQSFSNYNESKSEHTGSKARDNTSTRKRKPAQPESPESPSTLISIDSIFLLYVFFFFFFKSLV